MVEADPPELSVDCAGPAIPAYFASKEEWRHFLLRPPYQPPVKVVTASAYRRMAPAAREAYDEARLDHHIHMPPIKTPPMRACIDQALQLVRINRRTAPGPRMSLALVGDGGVGKSVIGVMIAAAIERDLRARYRRPPVRELNDWNPVVLATSPAPFAPRALDAEIVGWYGYPAARRTIEELLDIARELVIGTATVAIVLDDAHFARSSATTSARNIDHMKLLMNRLGVTFICIGADDDWLYADRDDDPRPRRGRPEPPARPGQMSGRFVRIDVEPFDVAQVDELKAWRAVLADIERTLLLIKATPGMLSDELADYCFARTHGYMASLDHLIRVGCILAIEKGKERLSDKLPDEVLLPERTRPGR